MSGAKSAATVGIYARVSTAEQVEGTSLATQLERCRAYAAAKGWLVAGEYIDEGVSGAKASRPALDQLMTDAREGKLQVIIVAKLDRAGRSMRHLVEMMGECDDLGVALVSVAEGFDSTTPAGRLQRNILGSFAEFEREQIRERTMSGTEAAARQGRWVGGPPPFGYYIREAGRDAYLEIDPRESEVVRRAWELFVVQRLSTAETAKILNQEELRPRRADRWTASLVRGFLREATALSGSWTYRRPGRGARNAPIEMSVPAILDPAEHEALRIRINSNATQRRHSNTYLLSGRITSPCGMTMQGIKNTAGTRLYRCANSFWHAEQRCDCRSVRAETIEQAVFAALESTLSGAGRTHQLAQAGSNAGGAGATVSTEELAAIERRVKRLEKAAGDSLAKALAAGVDPKIASHAAASLSAELMTARARRDQVASWVAANTTSARRVRDIDRLAKEIQGVIAAPDDATARRMIDLLGVRVTVTGWRPCSHCDGRGLIAVRKPGEREHIHGRVAQVCPQCQRHRNIPVIMITGVVPVHEEARAFTVVTDTWSA